MNSDDPSPNPALGPAIQPDSASPLPGGNAPTVEADTVLGTSPEPSPNFLRDYGKLTSDTVSEDPFQPSGDRLLEFAATYSRSTLHPEPIIADFQNWLQMLESRQTIFICGDEPTSTRWAAGRLAECGGFERIWETNWIQMGARAFRDVIPLLKRGATPDCMILETTALAFGRCYKMLSEAIGEATGDRRRYGLVVWMVDDPGFKQIEPGGVPENMEILQFRLPRAGSHGARSYDQTNFAKLFRPTFETLEEILEGADKTIIECTMVRIITLFGALPIQEFEMILSEVLGGKIICLRASGGVGAPPLERSAIEIWRSAKEHFLARAGLQRQTSGLPQRIEFVSGEAAEAAAAEAWNDPQEMLATFLGCAELNILFDERAEKDQMELYRGYMKAAVEVARHSPQLFGTRWLEAIVHNYAAWVRRKVGEVKLPEGGDLLALLVSVGKILENAKEQRKHWNYFCRRVACLCQDLASDPHTNPIVEEFMQRLSRAGMWQIVWRLSLELRLDEGFKFMHWARRVIQDESSLWKEAIFDLAWEASRSPTDACQVQTELTQWLPDNKLDSSHWNGAHRAAQIFPVAVIEVFQSSSFQEKGPPDRISEILLADANLIGKTVTILDLWAERLVSPGFGIAAIRFLHAQETGPFEFEELESLGVATSLLKLAAASHQSEKSAEAARALAKKVFQNSRITARLEIKRRLMELSRYFAEEKNRLPMDVTSASERNMLVVHYQLCRNLAAL